MATETAVATYDEKMLAALSMLSTPEESVAGGGVDVLKINYEEESAHPRGVWLLGQRKNKDGVITDEGTVVDKIVILTHQYRYSYYHEATKTYINTMTFAANSQPPDKAEVDAKIAAIRGAELKFQTVLYGLALLPDGTEKEFICYQGGVAYQPLKAHLKDIKKHPTDRNKELPDFSFVTELPETVKDKKGTTTFWRAVFKKGAMIAPEKLAEYVRKREEAYAYIALSNTQSAASKDKPAESGAASGPPSSMTYTPPVDPLAGMKMATGTDMPPPPDDKYLPPMDGIPEVDPAAYDIEAAMSAILGK